MTISQLLRVTAEHYRTFADTLDKIADYEPELEKWQTDILLDVGKMMMENTKKVSDIFKDA